jgi:hypothetical protein
VRLLTATLLLQQATGECSISAQKPLRLLDRLLLHLLQLRFLLLQPLLLRLRRLQQLLLLFCFRNALLIPPHSARFLRTTDTQLCSKRN